MIEINGNKIFCESLGTGIPLINIHGFGVDHQSLKGFFENIDILTDFKRIYFDLPGMGKTKFLKQLYHAEETYEIIKEIMKRTIGNEKYILIGQSYGGYLLRKFVKYDSENILGIIFICPVIIPDFEKRNLPERKIINNEIIDMKIINSKLYKDLMEMAVISNIEILENYEKNIYSGIKRADDRFLEQYRKNGYGYTENVDDIKKPFDKPVVFIMGRQDHIVGYKDAYNILENYTRANFCILDGCGHNLQIEKGEVLEMIIKDFLNGL
jgi:pimeloyl-ACP methyl ester carboxylesterase